MQGFSKYFTFEELTHTNHKSLQQENRAKAMQFINAGKRLSKLLGSIREAYGSPITISSGYRCPSVNTAVGSKARSSAHLRFEAGDCIPVGKDLKQFFHWLNANQDQFPDLRKAIIEYHKGIVHIEVKMSANEPQTFYATHDNDSFEVVA